MVPPIDHIVYAAVDLDAAVTDIAARFGVRPAAGGRHVGRRHPQLPAVPRTGGERPTWS